MTIKIKHKRGTASNITSANPTLAAGELAFETDTRRFKVGDGTTAWSSLSYVTPYVTATDRILGRSSAGAGSAEEITCTAFGRSLIGSADAAAARSTLSVQPTASPAFTGAATVTNDGNVVPLTVTNTGTANSFVVNDASGDTTPFVIDANGRVVIGGTAASSEGDVVSVINAAAATGNVSRLFVARASAPSSSTSAHNGFQSSIGTDAASFTVSALRHFIATQGTLGAGSSVTDQYGFAALSTITGATNNYGFYSDIASGTGRWNFYSNGTAASYFGGQVQISAGSASAPGVAFSGDPDTGIAQLSAAGANTLSICTNSAERMRVGSGGNVAIGAIDPQTALHIDKNADGALVILRGAQTANTQHILFRNPFHTNNGSAGTAFVGAQDTGSSGGNLIFATTTNGSGASGTPTERMRIDASGNVGIGNIVPAYRFEVRGAGAQARFYNSTTDAVVFIQGLTPASPWFGAGKSACQIDVDGWGGFAWQTDVTSGAKLFKLINNGGYGASESTVLTVNASGNVGIGISPSTLLHLNSLGVLRLQTGSVTMDCTPTAGAIDSFVWNTSANAAYRWSMNGQERMRIASDGKLYAYSTYETTVGGTNRDLFIDSGGLIGYVSSIRASKTNITAIDDVSWLRDLTPVSFHYRKRNEDGTYSDEADGTLDYGLIAEDVEPVAPELCFYDVVDGEPQLRGVHYSKLITPMLRYIQQLEARIAVLEERLNHA